ncbi:MAG: hypothetical protein LUF78_05935 [Clostridiales bacterium]|nr:hypothetical protein [Clostridiales bacterium]
MKSKRLFTFSLSAAALSALLFAPTAAYAESDAATASEASGRIEKIVANCESDPYGKAIYSFTYYLDSTEDLLSLTVDDFETKDCVYDGMETHEYFDSAALDVSFTDKTLTVEISPFYPGSSFSRDGYWSMDCINDLLDLDATTELEYSDPVVESFEEFTYTYGDATLDCYLYTPENATEDMPIVIFNSGGSGISTTGDLYGANFAVSFAKEEAQEMLPCYVLYPQRNEGSTDDLCAAIKEIVDNMVSEGKVDADRIYMTGESAGSIFTMNFVSRYSGYNAAIIIFDGGASYEGTTLEETIEEDADSPFSDSEMQQLAESGTKVMLVQSIGDTTSTPIRYATTYQKLVNYGMTPQSDIFWHPYTAEQFNALLGDRTVWAAMADSEYVTDPITGITTYMYPEGKLHNSSYPAANDQSIKLWLMDQSLAEYEVEFSDQYSAAYGSDEDYSIIPDKYTRVAVLEDAPGVPAGTTTTLTVYTDDEGLFYYIVFKTSFSDEDQYVEAINVNGVGHTVMDCSGTWWTSDIDNSVMPYILSTEIDWQPYEATVSDAE